MVHIFRPITEVALTSHDYVELCKVVLHVGKVSLVTFAL